MPRYVEYTWEIEKHPAGVSGGVSGCARALLVRRAVIAAADVALAFLAQILVQF
jgi:hypothetical protein